MKSRGNIICVSMIVVAITTRLLIDYLGSTAYFYNSVPQEVFKYSGFGSLLVTWHKSEHLGTRVNT
jgi:hypothetical protein